MKKNQSEGGLKGAQKSLKRNIKPQTVGQDIKTDDQPMKTEPKDSSKTVLLHLPHNVNYYSHFLKHPYITEKDIDWVLKLRGKDDDLKDKLNRIPNQPFGVFEKTIKSQETNHNIRDIKTNINVSNHEHLMRRRIGQTPSLSQVDFETSLRATTSKDQSRLIQLERGFTTVAKKDRKFQFPQFLPKVQDEKILKKKIEEEKESWKKMSIEEKKVFLQKMTKLTYSAHDGYNNYPMYNFKLNSSKNVTKARHLMNPDVFLSNVKWEMGLR